MKKACLRAIFLILFSTIQASKAGSTEQLDLDTDFLETHGLGSPGDSDLTKIDLASQAKVVTDKDFSAVLFESLKKSAKKKTKKAGRKFNTTIIDSEDIKITQREKEMIDLMPGFYKRTIATEIFKQKVQEVDKQKLQEEQHPPKKEKSKDDKLAKKVALSGRPRRKSNSRKKPLQNIPGLDVLQTFNKVEVPPNDKSSEKDDDEETSSLTTPIKTCAPPQKLSKSSKNKAKLIKKQKKRPKAKEQKQQLVANDNKKLAVQKEDQDCQGKIVKDSDGRPFYNFFREYPAVIYSSVAKQGVSYAKVVGQNDTRLAGKIVKIIDQTSQKPYILEAEEEQEAECSSLIPSAAKAKPQEICENDSSERSREVKRARQEYQEHVALKQPVENKELSEAIKKQQSHIDPKESQFYQSTSNPAAIYLPPISIPSLEHAREAIKKSIESTYQCSIDYFLADPDSVLLLQSSYQTSSPSLDEKKSLICRMADLQENPELTHDYTMIAIDNSSKYVLLLVRKDMQPFEMDGMQGPMFLGLQAFFANDSLEWVLILPGSAPPGKSLDWYRQWTMSVVKSFHPTCPFIRRI